MRIEIKPDDNQNWLNWGKLVNQWIERTAERPRTVKALRDQLAAHGVTAVVDGPEERNVVIQDYAPPGGPLVIMLPTKTMRDGRLAKVKPGLYPLPAFYDICFGGAKRVPLSEQEAKDFAFRRIGEYSVNECC
jgi:hypothetical protein